MRKVLIFSTLVIVIFSSCNKNNQENKTIVTDTVKVSKSEYSLSGTLWFQTSAEAKAIYFQGYNLAKVKLDMNYKSSKSKLKRAIVSDIDETLLDNSPFNARLLKTGELYTETAWNYWVKQAKAKALPGSVDFFNYAKEKGIEVFYVSNRSVSTLNETMENMKNEGFPYVDKEHFYLKSTTSNKSERRDSIAANYDIILFLGDNLRDFSEDFGKRGDDFGAAKVSESKDLFGTKYIVFPNPMYGEWEKAVYKNDYSKSDEEKAKLRLESLQDNF